MSYLQDYLKVLPIVDRNLVKKAILENQEILSIKNLTEEEFERLINQVAEEESIQTKPVKLSKQIMAEELNEFYSNVQLDLIHLFLEQNMLEGISANYDKIYSGNLNDMREQLNLLEEKIKALTMDKDGEDGLIIKSYAFEPSNKSSWLEDKGQKVPDSLWGDRDGSIIENATVSRTFHKYYCNLPKDKQTNLLQDENGETTASIEITYQSPYTVEIENSNYQIDKAIDSSSDTFWYSVALKPDNGLDSTSII